MPNVLNNVQWGCPAIAMHGLHVRGAPAETLQILDAYAPPDDKVLTELGTKLKKAEACARINCQCSQGTF